MTKTSNPPNLRRTAAREHTFTCPGRIREGLEHALTHR